MNSQSIIHQPREYVAPFDMNVFARVMQQKEQDYREGQRAVQTHLNGLASIDLIADTDKQYLNGKLTSLTKGLNQMGGMDLSDQSNVSALQNYIGGVSQDKRILNAYQDTTKIRTLQSGYDQIKKDQAAGKKGVSFSAANYDWDMRHVNQYLKDKQEKGDTDPTIRYSGGTTPTPYSDYVKKSQDIAKQVAPNIVSSLKDSKGNTYAYITSEKKIVSADRIWTAVNAQLSQEDKDQMYRDSQYRFKGTPDETLMESYLFNTKNQMENAKSQLEEYSKLKIAEQDPERLGQLQKEYEYTQKNLQARQDGLTKLAGKSPDQAKMEVFQDQFRNGLANTYAFSQEHQKVGWDQGKLLNARLAHDDAQFNASMKFKRDDRQTYYTLEQAKMAASSDQHAQELAYKNAHLQIEMAKAGLTGETLMDGTIAVTGLAGKSKISAIESSFSTEESALQGDAILMAKNAALAEQNKVAETTMLVDIASTRPELGEGLLDRDGNPTPKLRSITQKYDVTLDKMSRGIKADVTMIPKDYQDFYKQKHAIEIEMRANQITMDKVKNEALKELGAKDIKLNIDKYNKGASISSVGTKTETVVGTELGTAQVTTFDESKLNKADREALQYYRDNKGDAGKQYESIRQGIYLKNSSRISPVAVMFDDKQQKNTALKNAIATNAQRQGILLMNDTGGVEGHIEDNKGATINPAKMNIISVVRHVIDGKTYNMAKVSYKDGDGDDAVTRTGLIPIDAETQKAIPELNKMQETGLHTILAAGQPYTDFSISEDGANSVKYQIIKTPSRDEYNIYIMQPYDENGKPNKDYTRVRVGKSMATPEMAHAFAENIADTYDKAAEVHAKSHNGAKLPFRTFVNEGLAKLK